MHVLGHIWFSRVAPCFFFRPRIVPDMHPRIAPASYTHARASPPQVIQARTLHRPLVEDSRASPPQVIHARTHQPTSGEVSRPRGRSADLWGGRPTPREVSRPRGRSADPAGGQPTSGEVRFEFRGRVPENSSRRSSGLSSLIWLIRSDPVDPV